MQLTWVLKSFDELSTKELWQIYALRQMVFVVEQNSPYLDADEADLIAKHLYAYDQNDDIVAYARFFKDANGNVTFGRVVTAQSLRGKGIGKQLVTKLLDAIKEIYGDCQIQIEAQYHAVGFYEQFGFKETGEPFLDAGVKHITMIK